MTTGKTIALTRQTFAGKVMSLHFNMISRLITTFLQRSKCLLISWLQSPSPVMSLFVIKQCLTADFDVCHCFHCIPIYLPWSDGTKFHALHFLNVKFKSDVSLSYFTFIKRLFSSSHFLPLGWNHLLIWHCWYFSCQSWLQLMIHPSPYFAWFTLHAS